MEYKQGDKVMIVKNEWHHSFRIGDVVTLRERGNPTEEEPLWWSAERGSENSIIGESDFELYVDSEEGAELPMTTPEQYAGLAIDSIALSKANDTPQEQLAICRFMIDKYNRRQKNQDAADAVKLIAYVHWKQEIINNM